MDSQRSVSFFVDLKDQQNMMAQSVMVTPRPTSGKGFKLIRGAFLNYVDPISPIIDHLSILSWHFFNFLTPEIYLLLILVDISGTTYLVLSSLYYKTGTYSSSAELATYVLPIWPIVPVLW